MGVLEKILGLLNRDKIKHGVITAILVLYAATPLLSPAVDSASFRHIMVFFVCVCGATVLYKSEIRMEYLLYLLLWIEAFVATLLSSYVAVTSASATYLLFAIMVVCFANLCYSARDVRFFAKFCIGFALLIAVLIILSWLADIPHTPGCYSVGILGITKNPNYLNSAIILGASFLMYRLTMDIEWKKKVICSILLAIMIFGSLQTGTRAAMLAFILCAVFVLVYRMVVTKAWVGAWAFVRRSWKKVVLAALLAVVLVAVFFQAVPDTLKRRIVKLFSDSLRLEMWLQNILEFMKQPILGMGLNATTAFTETLELPVNNIHNTVLQMLCEQGILGFSIFALILWNNLRRARKHDRFLVLLMCVAMYFPILFQNNLTSNTFWWPLVFLEVFTRVSEREGLDVK